MPNRRVSFYGPGMRSALGGTPIQRDYMMDPRRQMGQQLLAQGSSTAPVQSPLEGLTRALTAGVGGYFGGQARQEMRDREGALNEDVLKVMAGGQAKPWVNPDTGTATIPGQQAPGGMGPPTAEVPTGPAGGYPGMQAALGGIDNPDIAPFAQQLGMSQMQQEQAMQIAEAQRSAKLADAIALKGAPGSTTGRPSSQIQNTLFREKLVAKHGPDSPDVKRFDDWVRATKLMDVGSGFQAYDPAAPGAPRDVAIKGLAPAQEPEVKREQAEASAIGGAVGKELGDAKARLSAAEASMPRLESAVTQLKALGEVATYTTAGRGADLARKEAGLEPSEGAIARSTYIAHVKNNVLPLLRQTFGAAFTAAEGDSLLATLGDPNMHPREKEAVLNAFIMDKRSELDALRRQTGGTAAVAAQYGAAPVAPPASNTSEDQQAMQWAQANPNDPRAAAIMGRLGGQ